MFLSKFILVFLPHLSQKTKKQKKQKKTGLSRTTLRIFFRLIEKVFHKDIYICEQVFFLKKNNYFIIVDINVIFRMTFFFFSI